jgi:hypothetical protein
MLVSLNQLLEKVMVPLKASAVMTVGAVWYTTSRHSSLATFAAGVAGWHHSGGRLYL